MQFKDTDIAKLDHLYKINLINSCSGYKSANLIGTKNTSEISNVAVFSSITHYGSAPPLLGFVLRPTTVPRNTYANIKETGSYTINHIHEGILEQAHHTSAKYPNTTSEFEMTTLEEEYKAGCFAPFVRGCPVQMEMQFVEAHHIKANDTLLVLGKIKNLFVDDELLSPDGFIDLSKGHIAAINGLDGYTVPKVHLRQSYQRPNI
ncbi:flavin reductase family protein [Zhouia amylolytica]|uniref:Flavin reductase like domain-containing protein n=1 Tax=Zhouia amylolytica AD3 TaxID=1286632 RepID=W2US41_9FLAO|nr:flavin reductase [Zhouia amylolytica]ETN96281.1 hypothetical protein P278_07920 [Zhouia amylolytica AD3]